MSREGVKQGVQRVNLFDEGMLRAPGWRWWRVGTLLLLLLLLGGLIYAASLMSNNHLLRQEVEAYQEQIDDLSTVNNQIQKRIDKDRVTLERENKKLQQLKREKYRLQQSIEPGRRTLEQSTQPFSIVLKQLAQLTNEDTYLTAFHIKQDEKLQLTITGRAERADQASSSLSAMKEAGGGGALQWELQKLSTQQQQQLGDSIVYPMPVVFQAQLQQTEVEVNP